MRSRKIRSLFVALWFLPLVVVPAWATQKQRTVIIALDQSASMMHSDPDKLRIEAAGLLAATQASHDRVGVILFGDTAQWLQKPVDRVGFNFNLLNAVGSSDAHTAFAPLLNAVEQYLTGQPSSYFQDHDISLVVLTDGRSDPADKLADADRSTALAIASQNGTRLTIYTIGLGNDLDADFLEHLAHPSNGMSIRAASAADLPDTFLRVAARLAALPVYRRNSSPQSMEWTGRPQRVVAVFTGERAASANVEGNVLYRSSHVVVAEEDPARDATTLDWTGHGLAFLCIQEPLRFSVDGEFPTTLLTDSPHPLTLTLESQHGALNDAFFLQSTSARLKLAGLDSETIPLHHRNSLGSFSGDLEAKSAGNFRARAYLESPYGRVETYLGDLTASVLPVAIPPQVSAGVFDPLPRAWFANKLAIRSTLPVGTVNLQFFPRTSPGATAATDRLPRSLRIAPGKAPLFETVLGGPSGRVHLVDYSATWSDGETEVTRNGTLRILVRQMSPGELVRDKWQWAAVLLLLLCTAIGAVWKFWPRPLQADLIVRQNGAQVLRLQLPSQLRTRMLHVAENEAGKISGSSTAAIAGPRSRQLLSLESTRRRGRWTIVAHPRAAHAPTAHGRKWAEIDLRAMHVPVFSTEDGTIQINVLYS